MAQKINYLVQDSDALYKAITNHRAAMEAKGFTEERLSTFVSAKENLKLKEVAQQNAVKFTEDKTAEQNALMKNIHDAIINLRNAAKSAYLENPQKLNIFQIGETIPASVTKMRPMCEYLTGVITAESAVLLKNGLTQEDLDVLGTSYNDLKATDADQENAKKLENAALKVRDKAEADLRKQVTKTRKFALACFAKSPEILVEFEPIPKGRGKGGGGDDDTPPDNPTPPPAQ